MYGLFIFQIVYGLNINAITYSEPTPVVDPASLAAEAAKNPAVIPKSGNLTANDKNASEIIPSGASIADSAVGTSATSDDTYFESTEPDTDTPSKFELTWTELGIVDPSAVCFEVNNTDLKVRVYPKQKKFGVSNFKKDIARSFSAEKKLLMTRAFDNNGVNAHTLTRFSGKSGAYFITAAEKLVQAGYFKEYTLKKNIYETYEPYYVLTPNGVKAFTTKEAAAVMNRKPLKCDTRGEIIPDRANSLLTRIISCKAEDLMLEVCPSGKFTSNMPILGTEFFVSEFSISALEKSYIFTSIISSNIEEFSLLKDFWENFKRHVDILVIVGMNISHAKSLADWIESFLSAGSDTAIYYYNMEKIGRAHV